MAANTKQKIAVLDIDANVQNTIEQKLADGYAVQFMVVWNDILLIIYSLPDFEPVI